jgi:predicted GTPase
VQDATGVEELARASRRRDAEADLILLIVDAQARSPKPMPRSPVGSAAQRSVLVVANRSTVPRGINAAAFHALGLGAPVSVSGMRARHRRSARPHRRTARCSEV